MSLATKLRTPKFWAKPSLLGHLLWPLSLLYSAAASYNQNKIRPAYADVPVISVGNITLGGAGKTPIAIALTNILIHLGRHPHLLSRGFGAEEPREPIRVDPDLHSPQMVGDEPLILARTAPTWVFPDRRKSAHFAVQSGADCVVLDDGLQHHALHKDISFLVIDTSYGVGNGHTLPAGPLRESLDLALDRTTAIIALGSDPLTVHMPQLKPIFRAALIPTPEWADLKGKAVIPFAGLARPEKFFSMCEKAGMAVVERLPFPDHYQYSRIEITRLVEHASLMDATLVTTEKDYVKLHPDDRATIRKLGVSVMWQDEPALESFLKDHLESFTPPTIV